MFHFGALLGPNLRSSYSVTESRLQSLRYFCLIWQPLRFLVVLKMEKKKKRKWHKIVNANMLWHTKVSHRTFQAPHASFLLHKLAVKYEILP